MDVGWEQGNGNILSSAEQQLLRSGVSLSLLRDETDFGGVKPTSMKKPPYGKSFAFCVINPDMQMCQLWHKGVNALQSDNRREEVELCFKTAEVSFPNSFRALFCPLGGVWRIFWKWVCRESREIVLKQACKH